MDGSPWATTSENGELGPRAAVLLIQGVGASGLAWAPQVEALQTRFVPLAFDHAGICGRPEPAERLTVSSLADDSWRVLTEQGFETAHLVGHSLGGLIALELALRNPRAVRSLTLMCTFADGRGPLRFSWRMAWIGSRTRIGTRGMRRRAFLELILPRERLQSENLNQLADEYAQDFGHDLADQPPVVSQQLHAMGKCDLTHRLAELADVPTLVMSASQDPIAPPRLGRTLAQGIPGSKFVEFPDASHGLPLTHPAPVNRLLLDHVLAAEARFPRR